MFIIEEVNLDNPEKRETIQQFLDNFDLKYENDIDYSLAVYDDGSMIASASKAKNILKCFAVSKAYQGEGITGTLVKKIEDRMFREGLYHFFIITPYTNKKIFTSIGYQEIITSNNISILENGNLEIRQFLTGLKTKSAVKSENNACIIINGNPFTLGHLYLIEKASGENEHLLVFVVTEDKSSFPFRTRFKLIKAGTKHITNITVLETGPYLISNITFPTYFLKSKSEAVNLQSAIDCDIFVKYYVPLFKIVKRYIGTEPYCEVTKTYNETIKRILPKHGVEVNEVSRKMINRQIISASKVRELIGKKAFASAKQFVPQTTYDYLISSEAEAIICKIAEGQGRH